MSTGLAIGAVSAVLKSLLLNQLADPALSGAVGRVDVSALPPDRIRTGEPDEHAQLNLFLYQVTPNLGWRNVGLPAVDADGGRIANPPLGVDLHYLVSAYAGQDLDAEILLGLAMQVLHETPVLSRDLIRRSLPSGGGARAAALSASGLADQVEQITLTPQAIGGEEMSRLWSATQSRFRPSVAYHVSVVLIQRHRPTRVTHPVRTRRLSTVVGRAPQVDRVTALDGSGEAPLLPGSLLVIQGTGLAGDGVQIEVGGVGLPSTVVSGQELRATLDSADLRAGVTAVQVTRPVLRRPAPDHDIEVSSNVVAIVLRPAVRAAVGAVTSRRTGTQELRSADLTLSFTPALGARQQVSVLLTGRDSQAAYRIDAPAQRDEALRRLTLPVTDVAPGRYTVQARVDGADSLIRPDAADSADVPEVTL